MKEEPGPGGRGECAHAQRPCWRGGGEGAARGALLLQILTEPSLEVLICFPDAAEFEVSCSSLAYISYLTLPLALSGFTQYHLRHCLPLYPILVLNLQLPLHATRLFLNVVFSVSMGFLLYITL